MNYVRFALTHVIAGAVVIGGTVVFVVMSYVALLVLAIVFDKGLGGPLALPFMLAVTLIASGLSVVCVLAPVTILAERLGRGRGRQTLFQLLVSALLVLIEVIAIATVARFGWGISTREVLGLASIAAVVLLGLLCVYWSCLKSTNWVLRLFMRAPLPGT